jgi:hypothetical protein
MAGRKGNAKNEPKQAANRQRANRTGVIATGAGEKIMLRSGREIALKPYHLPLTKRFPLGLTDAAYAKLRTLAEASGIGNNYTLTVLLENADKTINRRAFEAAIARLKETMGRRNQ